MAPPCGSLCRDGAPPPILGPRGRRPRASVRRALGALPEGRVARRVVLGQRSRGLPSAHPIAADPSRARERRASALESLSRAPTAVRRESPLPGLSFPHRALLSPALRGRLSGADGASPAPGL